VRWMKSHGFSLSSIGRMLIWGRGERRASLGMGPFLLGECSSCFASLIVLDARLRRGGLSSTQMRCGPRGEIPPHRFPGGEVGDGRHLPTHLPTDAVTPFPDLAAPCSCGLANRPSLI